MLGNCLVCAMPAALDLKFGDKPIGLLCQQHAEDFLLGLAREYAQEQGLDEGVKAYRAVRQAAGFPDVTELEARIRIAG